MEKRNLTCIGCPMGCQITVEFEGEEVFSVKGNTCAIGDKYARQEVTHPERTVTSTVVVVGGAKERTSLAAPRREQASRRTQTFRRTRSSSAWMRSTKSAPRHL